MEIFIFILSCLPAIAGLYLCGDFLFWRITAQNHKGEITKFQDIKSRGRALPIVKIQDDKDTKITITRIDSLSHLLDPAITGQSITVSIKGQHGIIFGYAPLLAGLLLILPCVILLGQILGNTIFASQAIYVLLLTGITLGGWIILKLIQRS